MTHTEASRRTDRLLDIARELLAVDTRNPPGDTRQLADWIETLFRDLDIAVERVTTDPAKPNLVATIPGRSDRTLLFVGHMDTVPFDADAWSYDPLGERDGDRLYGRGATDMKGPLAAILYTAERFAAADREPPVTLAVAVVSDEETGGEAGVEALVADGALDEIDPDGCVIGETTSTGGRHSVTVADRGSIWLTLDAEGTAAHGSRPMAGDNAVDRLWAAVSMLRERLPDRAFSLDDEVAAIVAESVDYYAPTLGRAAARDLFERPTVNLGRIEGGDAVNTVPGSARAELDIRATAGVDTAGLLAAVREWLADYPAVSIADVSRSVGSYEPIDGPLVEAVTDAASEAVEGRLYRRSATGGGDAKTFRHAGIPTVEFAVGTDTAHAVDEYTTVEALRRTAAVYERLPAIFGEHEP
ncbi:M20 family metallopeptidase [Halohasta salina]|uniref:M20 family metallopeptidase n=1 Tax=Halohasta salina TaxID=2961621 RepID=UPI0020A369B8|nr:M20/M25/M40 family metallo-hydrolase [Halohasta salina]